MAGMADMGTMVQSALAMLEDGALQMYEELAEECRDADLLVNYPYQLAGTMVRDRLGTPCVPIHFSPFAGLASNKRVVATTAPVANRIRAKVGLPPQDDPLGADAVSPRLNLFAISEHVFRRPVRWPPHFHLTGFAFLLDETFEPEPALRAFLEAGPPPVVVTFSSAMHADEEAVTRAVLEGVARAGCRAVLQHGWSGLARGVSLPSEVIAIGDVPHSWLFPRAACVVHAAGAGTSAAALRAGIPSVAVPHWLDQPLWARILRELGCVEAVVPFSSLSGQTLGEALSLTLASERVRQRAAEMGTKLRAEDGVGRIIELVEACVTDGPRSQP